MNNRIQQILGNEIDPAYAKRAKFIFQIFESEKPKNILEVGCGRGFYLQGFSLYTFPKKIYGVDINSAYLKKAKKNCKDKRIVLQEGSVYALPYKENAFDFILLSEILEHLTDDKKALEEIKRVLKPGGMLVITVPNYNFPFLWDPINWILMRLFNTHINKNIWWLAGIWADHERLYKKEQIVSLIEKENFIIEQIEELIRFSFPFTHLLLYGIGKNLVERFGINNFNRFNYSQKKKISRLIAKFFSLPSRMFDKYVRSGSSMNIVILARK